MCIALINGQNVTIWLIDTVSLLGDGSVSPLVDKQCDIWRIDSVTKCVCTVCLLVCGQRGTNDGMEGEWLLVLVCVQCDYWCMDRMWLIMNGRRVAIGVFTVWLLVYGQRVTNNDGQRLTIGVWTVWELLGWIVLLLVGFT